MIVPRARLLLWVVATLIPAAALAAAPPLAGAATLLYCAAALLMVVPAADALLAGRRLEGVDVRLPERSRLTKGDAGEIEVSIRHGRCAGGVIRLGLPLPAELACDTDEMDIALPAGVEASTVSLECRPVRRGSYAVTTAYVGSASPLGFWLKRRAVPVRAEIRVYPSMLGERKNLAAMFLTRGGLGVHAQRQVGHGREFEKLRDYVPGDGYGEIHWKATAKRARPATKVFQIERTQEVYVLIDSSRLSARTAAGAPEPHGDLSPTALERFVTGALILGMAAERQGDLFGIMSFGDRVENFIRARNGKAHYRACRDALFALQPGAVTPDFTEVFSFIRMRMRRRALLVFLTNLDDPIVAEQFAGHVGLIARKHLVLVNMIQPPGVRAVFSDPDVSGAEDVYAHLAGHLQWHRLGELTRGLRHRGVRFSLLGNESFCPDLVSQYIGVKQRQLL